MNNACKTLEVKTASYALCILSFLFLSYDPFKYGYTHEIKCPIISICWVQLVNICSNDGQRLFDACAIGPLLFGGPIVLLYGTVYSAFLIGPWALIGSATFIAFYPFMVCL
jgi:hypothetical protein